MSYRSWPAYRLFTTTLFFLFHLSPAHHPWSIMHTLHPPSLMPPSPCEHKTDMYAPFPNPTQPDQNRQIINLSCKHPDPPCLCRLSFRTTPPITIPYSAHSNQVRQTQIKKIPMRQKKSNRKPEEKKKHGRVKKANAIFIIIKSII